MSEKVICRKGWDTDTVQPGNGVPFYYPDPISPDINEILKALEVGMGYADTLCYEADRDWIHEIMVKLRAL